VQAHAEVEVLEAPAAKVARKTADFAQQRAGHGEVAGVGEAPGLVEPVEVVEARAQGGLPRAVGDHPEGAVERVAPGEVGEGVGLPEIVKVVPREVPEDHRAGGALVDPVEVPEEVTVDGDVGVEEGEVFEAGLVRAALPRQARAKGPDLARVGDEPHVGARVTERGGEVLAGAVVDDEHLVAVLGVRLRREPLDHLAQHRHAVTRGHHHGDGKGLVAHRGARARGRRRGAARGGGPPPTRGCRRR
jgi:hypothetical protein